MTPEQKPENIFCNDCKNKVCYTTAFKCEGWWAQERLNIFMRAPESEWERGIKQRIYPEVSKGDSDAICDKKERG